MKPRVLLIAGYFDWFSGYQETVIAPALARRADLEILASDRVAPIFGDAHLSRLGVARRYEPGTRTERGIQIHRVRTCEWRGMVWGRDGRPIVERGNYDLIVQVMPGQALPLAASVSKANAQRVVLYGDNSAMWANLSSTKQRLKWLVFATTKGASYRFANKRAEVSYGYTPETLSRLAPFAKEPMRLLPLAFDASRFFLDHAVRAEARAARGYDHNNTVIVSAGKFKAVKRLDLLVRGFARSQKFSPHLRLLLVGDETGEQSSEIRELITELGIDELVRVEGFLDGPGLNAAFNAADIGVWPVQPAITIQQAMATGLPVVLPKNSLVGHLLTDSTGVYFDGPATEASIAMGIGAAAELSHAAAREKRAIENERFSGDGVIETILTDVGLA